MTTGCHQFGPILTIRADDTRSRLPDVRNHPELYFHHILRAAFQGLDEETLFNRAEVKGFRSVRP
jgi:hypothetical protein